MKDDNSITLLVLRVEFYLTHAKVSNSLLKYMQDAGMSLIPADSHNNKYWTRESSPSNCFVFNAQGHVADLFLLFLLLKPTYAVNRIITMQKNMESPSSTLSRKVYCFEDLTTIAHILFICSLGDLQQLSRSLSALRLEAYFKSWYVFFSISSMICKARQFFN